MCRPFNIAVLLLFSCCLTPVVLNAFCFEEAGRQFGISPALLENIARLESDLRPGAVNRNRNGSTDIGLMQVNSYWIRTLGLDSGDLLSDPCYNTKTGARILKKCIDRYGYNWEAVGCYNATSGDKKIRYSWKVYNRLEAGAKGKLPVAHQTEKTATRTAVSELIFSSRDRFEEAR